MARATAPVVGVVLLVAITVVCGGAVTAALAVAPSEPPPAASFELRVDSTSDRIAVTHVGGDAVSPDALSLSVTVGGEPLAHQPPVPFFAATGFLAGPTGPFNAATTGDWRAGQTGAIRLASTNTPRIEAGETVRVTLATDRAMMAKLEATAVPSAQADAASASVAVSSASSSGSRATVVMARGLPGRAC